MTAGSLDWPPRLLKPSAGAEAEIKGIVWYFLSVREEAEEASGLLPPSGFAHLPDSRPWTSELSFTFSFLPDLVKCWQ